MGTLYDRIIAQLDTLGCLVPGMRYCIDFP